MIGYLLAFVFLVNVGSTISKKTNTTDEQIIMGEPTTIASHPHQISLQRLSSDGSVWYHSCGGSIVRSNWVVTAAHCVEGASASVLRVVLNNGSLSDPNRKPYNVARSIMHPKYEKGRGFIPNDIALLELETGIDLSGTNKAIALADAGENFVGETCEISGWGHTVTGTSGNKVIPDQLQETNGVILTDNGCNQFYLKRNYNGAVHICIDNKNTGTCQGDSGGPMVCLRGSTPVLAGATSWGRTGCDTTYPSVYTEVSTYRTWLDQTMSS